MPRINQYTDNTTIENDDKMLTYDTQGAATKLTAFSTIWNWIVSKLHALTSSSAALTPSTDRVLMDKNGTMTRVEPAAVAKYGIETYNGSTIAGSAQTVKSALDTLNSNLNNNGAWYELLGSKTENGNYTLNASYAEYKSVVVMLFGSGNSIASCIYPTTMLITAGYHPVVEVLSNKVEIEFKSATSVTVSGLVGSVRIYGIR